MDASLRVACGIRFTVDANKMLPEISDSCACIDILANYIFICDNLCFSSMAKSRYYRQKSIKEAQDVLNNDADEHYENFCNLLFDELLNHIKNLPFDRIINQDLLVETKVFNLVEAHCLYWLHTSDRYSNDSTTTYSLRFPNFCNPELYGTFEIQNHHIFSPLSYARHGFVGWYQYTGCNLVSELYEYFNLQRLVGNPSSYEIKLFMNKKQERIEIQFDFKFYPNMQRIIISFGLGYSAQL